MYIKGVFLKFIGMLAFFLSVVNAFSQTNQKEYDIFSDTLLVINGETINNERVLISRNVLVEADTFKVNQRGIKIVGFTMTAFALGKSVELQTDKAILTKEMHDVVLNKQTNYKFISIKNINLQTKDGRAVDPSLKAIKFIFSN